MAQRTDQRQFVEADYDQRIISVGREPGALSGDVEHPKLACDPGILQLKIRIEIDNAVVPPELAAIDHDGHGRGEKCLCVRTDLENCAGIDQHTTGLAAHAEALGVDEAVADDDADSEPGHVERLHPTLDVGFDIGDQRLEAHLRGRVGLDRLRCRRLSQVHVRLSWRIAAIYEQREYAAAGGSSGGWRLRRS
jgi:hypothetical protein